jgi:hypothetical protein
MDAEAAGLIGGGGDHPPGTGAADQDWLTGQCGVVQHFDGGVEGVEVDVEDAAGHPVARSVGVARSVR